MESVEATVFEIVPEETSNRFFRREGAKLINTIEHIIGRKEYECGSKPTAYINKNLDDIWAAVIRMHVLLVVMIIFSKKGS